jgi:hypothetical protein
VPRTSGPAEIGDAGSHPAAPSCSREAAVLVGVFDGIEAEDSPERIISVGFVNEFPLYVQLVSSTVIAVATTGNRSRFTSRPKLPPPVRDRHHEKIELVATIVRS